MNLGENIYKFRTQKNLSQGDLANALDVSRQSVSKWENGAAVPELDKLIKMADLFGITLDELAGRAAPAPAPEPREIPPAQPQGIQSGDLVSILLLLFGVMIPIVIVATGEMHDSTVLLVLGLFVIPPLVTICAALCSPKNKVLFRTFLVYDIVFGLLACIAGNVLAPFIAIVFFFAAGFWSDRLEK